jgi:hypothetical protein
MSFHQDFELMTRDMHNSTLEVEYMKKVPLLNLILKQKNLEFDGGVRYYFEADTGPYTDDTQDYSGNDPLSHSDQGTLDRPYFTKKKFQRGLTIDDDEELGNAIQNEDGTQLHKLMAHKMAKHQEAMRLHLRKLIYGAASDSSKMVQGLNSALVVDSTYGTLARTHASSIRDWWQPYNNLLHAGSSTGQGTEQVFGIPWLQGVMDPMFDLESEPGDFTVVMGNVLYLAAKQEALSLSMPVKHDPRGLWKYGIEEMEIDSANIMKDPFLQAQYNTSMGLSSGAEGSLERRVYGLNIPDWHLFVHPNKYFAMTDFFDQSKIAGSADFQLARVRFAGNLACKHPNRSFYFSNVTP